MGEMQQGATLAGVQIAFIGSGAMGDAMIKGLLARKMVTPTQIVAGDPVVARREQVHADYGVAVTDDNVAAVQDADIVILCVKPQVAGKVMAQLAGRIPDEALVLSIMAGVSIAAMAQGLGHVRIVRSIPNTPAQLGMGMTVWTATPDVSQEQLGQAAAILGALGDELGVAEERYLDMATGLSGSGPAFVFLLVEAMIDAGVQIGFARADAERLVLQTIEGSVALMRSTKSHPAELRNRVTSPGGTTAAGLFELEAGGVRATMTRAIEAAYRRSQELGTAMNSGEKK